MSEKHRIRRYSAFFQGWAQAFGNHRGTYDDERDLNWLFGEDDDQIGLIMSPRVKRRLFREVLADHRTQIKLTLGPERIGVGRAVMPCSYRDKQAIAAIHKILEGGTDVHMFLSYHLIFPSGTRILTLSPKAPLPIIYREIDSLTVLMD